jgi:lysozyme
MPLLNVIVDLSHHNTVSDFAQVRDAGIVAVIHKATEGTTGVDATYDERKVKAKAAGLLWGAYHFGGRGDVDGQVDHFLDTANPAAGDLLVLDFEPNKFEGTMSLAEAEAFVVAFEKRTGQAPVLYSGQAFLLEQLGDTVKTPLADCPLWIARYSAKLPVIPQAFRDFAIWQYTDGNSGPQPHQVSGIDRCDRDKFNGDDEEALRMFWSNSGFPGLMPKAAKVRVSRQKMVAKQASRGR